MEREIKFLKKGIKYEGRYIPVFYSMGNLTGYPTGTITIYAKRHNNHLPAILNPKNDTDSMTDYFESDTANIVPNSKYYLKVVFALGKINQRRLNNDK